MTPVAAAHPPAGSTVAPSTLPDSAPATAAAPTLWGLTPVQLHDRLWASRGVQIVRRGVRSELVDHAELYLLMDSQTLAICRLGVVLDQFAWLGSTLCSVRLTDIREHGYRESVVADQQGHFQRFRRIYGGGEHQLARVALTADRDVASMWQTLTDDRGAWRTLTDSVRRSEREIARLRARLYDASDDREAAAFVRDLQIRWTRPDVTISDIAEAQPNVWAHATAKVDKAAACTGVIWVGAGRTLAADAVAVGPAVLWDAPDARPTPPEIHWIDLEPISPLHRPAVKKSSKLADAAKRFFDVAFALLAILVTLPLYPLIALLIVIEDGWPVFFSHERETVGGRTFGCIKFRSMRRDAEKIKAQLQAANQADGPQFYMENDPRLTRVGHYIRKYQLDELPQFFNVLKGDMSIVGPRPSPFKENQFCPGWREARLSVRPGVTGLWQIRRTRAHGADFQEWIKYDIQYVETRSFWLDLYIIWKTVTMLLGRFTKS